MNKKAYLTIDLSARRNAQLGIKMDKKLKGDRSQRIIRGIAYVLTTIVSLICVIPFYLVIVASFSSEQDIIAKGFSIWPAHFSLDAYKLVFQVPETIFRAYGVSIFITAVGTVTGLFVTTMAAYVLCRRTCRYRNQIAFFFYFTTLFSGGMIPTYIWLTQSLHLKDNIFVMVFPLLMSSWNILLMRNFMRDIPEEMAEAATIDGASEFTVFVRLFLPLAKAGLATIGLFMGLAYWNDWYHAMLYINKSELYPLQYLLYDMQNSIEGIKKAAAIANVPSYNMPTESFKMAMAVVATGPIILLYPFVQKYFIKGLTVGAVKG